MRFNRLIPLLLALAAAPAFAQSDADFQLVLPQHTGQLTFTAKDYKVVQHSAKPNGNELGIRADSISGDLHFLSFLFDFSEHAPLTSAKCRDGEMKPAQIENRTLKILATSEIASPDGQPISVVDYTAKSDAGATGYMTRAFIATGNLCGDLEFYSGQPIHFTDASFHSVFASLQLDPNYTPSFKDTWLYAQILFDAEMYAGAAPIYELALKRLAPAPGVDVKTMTRVLTDQAGMSYGMSGNIPKARTIFENAIPADPDYPMYYYNLACADAEENKLADARKDLEKAYARKANVIHGEKMPDPTRDDSFTAHRSDKHFWEFVQSLAPQ